jgi:hypothetical protein
MYKEEKNKQEQKRSKAQECVSTCVGLKII